MINLYALHHYSRCWDEVSENVDTIEYRSSNMCFYAHTRPKNGIVLSMAFSVDDVCEYRGLGIPSDLDFKIALANIVLRMAVEDAVYHARCLND